VNSHLCKYDYIDSDSIFIRQVMALKYTFVSISKNRCHHVKTLACYCRQGKSGPVRVAKDKIQLIV
jgi:hypothetical protein